ncbi:MAG: AAA family ATPase [Candidatus Hydrothermarchaeaceae archaeon]
MLVLVCGLPASGKSTLSKKIAKKLKTPVLSTDAIRKHLFENPTYTSDEKDFVYKSMFLVAEYLLKADRNVVLDGTFYKRCLRGRAYDITKITGMGMAVVECRSNDRSIRRRMGRRAVGKDGLSDADYEVYKKIKKDFEPIKRDHLVLDTDRPKQKNLDETLRYLNLL